MTHTHTGEKTKLKIGSESMKMLHSIKTLILLASVPAMTFIPGRMLEAFEAEVPVRRYGIQSNVCGCNSSVETIERIIQQVTKGRV